MFPHFYITTDGYLAVGSLRKMTNQFAGMWQKDITTLMYSAYDLDVKYSRYEGVLMYVKYIACSRSKQASINVGCVFTCIYISMYAYTHTLMTAESGKRHLGTTYTKRIFRYSHTGVSLKEFSVISPPPMSKDLILYVWYVVFFFILFLLLFLTVKSKFKLLVWNSCCLFLVFFHITTENISKFLPLQFLCLSSTSYCETVHNIQKGSCWGNDRSSKSLHLSGFATFSYSCFIPRVETEILWYIGILFPWKIISFNSLDFFIMASFWQKEWNLIFKCFCLPLALAA